MLCRIIELRPYGDHDTGILIVDFLNHAFRVRETFLIKLVATPCVYRPIAPILYDHIQGNLPPAVFVQGGQRNIAGVTTTIATILSPYMILNNRKLVVSKAALAKIEEVYA